MKRYYIAIFIFFVVGLLIFSLDYFVFQKNKNVFQEITKEREREEMVLKEQEYLEKLSQSLKEKSDFLSKIKDGLIDEQHFVTFVNFLEDFLAQNNLEAKVAFERKTENSFIFKISFSSPFEKGFRFLRKVEWIPYFLRIERLQIISSPQKDHLDNLNFEITIAVLAK